ncbi:MAG: hypothetical protein AABY26_07105 [Nanoarchaeota archaeon]
MTVGNEGNGKNSGRRSEWIGFGNYFGCYASGLEGKLQGVKVGDFLVLSAPQVRVAGFVQRWDSKRVELTYFDPNCTYEFEREKIVRTANGYAKENRKIWHWDEADTLYLTQENRTYNLKKFQQYALLPDNLPSPQDRENYSPVRDLAGGKMSKSLLDEVKLGDLILLRDYKLRVGGFAFRKTEQLLSFSHIDPNSELQGNALCRGSYSKGWLFYGNDVVSFYTEKFGEALLFPRIREVPKEEPERGETAAEEDDKVPIIYSDFSSQD